MNLQLHKTAFPILLLLAGAMFFGACAGGGGSGAGEEEIVDDGIRSEIPPFVDEQFPSVVRFQPEVEAGAADFGKNVVLSGSTAIVAGQGFANVYDQSSGSWVKIATLRPPGATSSAVSAIHSDLKEELTEFGKSISIDGDQIAVGGRQKVYIFTKEENSEWSPTVLLQPLVAGVRSPTFAQTIWLTGSWLIIGQPESSRAGATYIYYRRPGTSAWVLVRMFASDTVGGCVADRLTGIGNRLVIGDTRYSQPVSGGEPIKSSGQVCVIELSNTGSILTTVLRPEEPSENLRFGGSLSIDDRHLLVGAPGKKSVYSYRRSDDDEYWEFEGSFSSIDAKSFGGKVSLDLDYAIVVGRGCSESDRGALDSCLPKIQFHIYEFFENAWRFRRTVDISDQQIDEENLIISLSRGRALVTIGSAVTLLQL